MAQQALDIHRHLAVPGCLGKEGTVEVAVHQAGEVIDLGLDIRQLIEPEGIAHPHGGAGPLFFVGGEILVADGAGGLRRLPVHIRTGPGEPLLHIRIRGIQLGKHGGAVAAFGSRKAGGHHGAAHLLAFVALIVDVVIQGHRADHQYVIRFFHSLSPILPACAAVTTPLPTPRPPWRSSWGSAAPPGTACSAAG